MGNYVRNCTQTWVRVSKFSYAHDHVSQKVAQRHVFILWTLSFESVKPTFSDIVSCVKSWIQRRIRKLKSCGGPSFRLQMWVVSWKRWCHMLNVTHRHVFVSQKVCRHSSCSVRTCAWTRLVGDTFVWCVVTCLTDMRTKLINDKNPKKAKRKEKLWTLT